MIPEPFTLERPGADWTRHGKTKAPKILPPPGEVWRTPGGRKQAGRYYTRVTTLVKALEEAHALYGWKVRRAVVGLGRRPDLQLLAASLTAADHDRAAVEELAERCIEASGSSAAAVGTALHTFTERIDRGEPIEHIPEAFRELVEAWQRITAPLRLEYREVHTVHDGLAAAGTPDAFGFCELPDPDGVVDDRRVIDLKSGRIDYPASMSGQLYVYADSDLYDPETGERRPLEVNQRWGLIAHLKSDSSEPPGLYWLNLEHGRRCVELAIPVREWRAVKADAIIRPALVEERTPAMPAPGDELVDITERLVVPSERIELEAPTVVERCPGCGHDLASTGVCEGCRAYGEALAATPGDVLPPVEASPSFAGHCPSCNVHHEDPLPWCDCRPDETCAGPCRRRAHDPAECPVAVDLEPVETAPDPLGAMTERMMRHSEPLHAAEPEPRCELSDLLVSECACRVHRPDVQTDTDGQLVEPEPEPAELDPIAVAIARAGSPRELVLLWQQHRAAWTPEHDELAAARRQQLDEQRALERPHAALAAAIATATHPDTLLGLWRAHEELWTDEHHALAAARLAELKGRAA